MPPIRLLVSVEGGIVQDITTDAQDVDDILVYFHDADVGAEEYADGIRESVFGLSQLTEPEFDKLLDGLDVDFEDEIRETEERERAAARRRLAEELRSGNMQLLRMVAALKKIGLTPDQVTDLQESLEIERDGVTQLFDDAEMLTSDFNARYAAFKREEGVS